MTRRYRRAHRGGAVERILRVCRRRDRPDRRVARRRGVATGRRRGHDFPRRQGNGLTDTGRAWPDLDVPGWNETRDTLHMWLQVVGKIRLALTPLINHWWNVPLYVSARGLTTSLMHAGSRGLEIEFDFVDHALRLRTTDGQARTVALESQSVAAFYRATTDALAELGTAVHIVARPSEIEDAIPFAQDEVHHTYEREVAHRL